MNSSAVHWLEQISYECEKSRHTARSRHGIEEIFSTNHIAREHLSSNQNARTRYRHGHGTARPYRNFLTVIRNLHYTMLFRMLYNVIPDVIQCYSGCYTMLFRMLYNVIPDVIQCYTGCYTMLFRIYNIIPDAKPFHGWREIVMSYRARFAIRLCHYLPIIRNLCYFNPPSKCETAKRSDGCFVYKTVSIKSIFWFYLSIRQLSERIQFNRDKMLGGSQNNSRKYNNSYYWRIINGY
jgi:hypothetical protein